MGGWALLLQDLQASGYTQCSPGSPLSLEEVKALLPTMAEMAARWTGCHDAGINAPKAKILETLKGQPGEIKLWTDKEHVAACAEYLTVTAPLVDLLAHSTTSGGAFGSWDKSDDLPEQPFQLLCSQLGALMASVHPIAGG